jgi:NADPH:quinone reductase-like Zn-dependent oxidoreductase
MRALRIHAYGGPEVMRVEEAPEPQAARGQVRVRVLAASVNPIDWKMRRGLLAAVFPVAFPRILGRDCAGEMNGRLVAGVAEARTDGTHAEFALLPASATAAVPPGLDAAAAASLCVAGLSAWIALVETARLAAGMRVLVHAGAGGVGSLAIQIARALGATVLATSTQSEYCRKLGADRVIDYRCEDFVQAGPYDVVLDTLGGDTHVRSLGAVRPGGMVVALAAAPIPAHRPIPGVRIEKPAVVATRERLSALFEWAAAGRIVPQVNHTYPLQDAAKGYAASEGRHATGKIVLQIA